MRRAAVILLCVVACATAKTGAGGDGGGTGTGDGGGTGTGIDAKNPADANGCAKQPCSLTPQCGCAAGSACQLDNNNLATGGTTCEAAGSGTEATTCTADTTCAAGHGCIGGRCRTWCASDTDCTSGPGALCIIGVVYGTPQMPVPGATVCTTDCDPSSKTPAGCPATWACHIYQEQAGQMRYLTDCDPNGGGGVGAICNNGNTQCQAGLDCIAVNRSGTITNECHPSCICPGGNCAAGSCTAFPGSGSCNAFTTKVMIGTREYGVCL